MNKPNFIINLDNTSSNEVPHFHSYSFLFNKIISYLKEHFKKDFFLYDGFEGLALSTASKDFSEGIHDVEILAYIADCLDTYSIKSLHKKHTDEPNFSFEPFSSNCLYYYPSFEVAIGIVPSYDERGYSTRTTVLLSTSNKNMKDFLCYLTTKQRNRDKNYVTTITDTSRGPLEQTEKITSLIDRSDVILDDKTKKQIYRAIDEFFNENSDFYQKYNIPYKRGILLHGKPGNGKTTLVKSIASSIDAPVIYWQITEFTTSNSIMDVFNRSSTLAPCVLVIEDIDSMPNNVRSVFLNTLDGATSKEGIFLIGTTNYPEKIDPALMNRAGRFDHSYEIKTPTLEIRKFYLEKKNIIDFISFDELQKIIKKTEGFSIAQLNELYTQLALQKHYDGTVDIDIVIDELKGMNKKQQKGNWNTEENKQSLGFGTN